MPTVIKTFPYMKDGYGLHQATIPAGATSVEFHIWGGGGGGGGGDRAGPGRSGSAGHYVTGTIDLTGASGQILAVGVGGGAAGKNNGRGLTGYSGGIGGTQGPNGSSGHGGGGGGATVIRLAGTDMAIAGGGGGGGGDGLNSVGTVGINSNDPTIAVPGTLGENGADHSGDGAGAGAGGGGADGGRSGNGPGGDDGATGGYAGSNLVPAGGTQNNGSGTTPGGTGSGYYYTLDVPSIFTSGAQIINHFNDVIADNPTTSTAWWVITPNLSWTELIGSDLYNDSIAIDFNDETVYSGSNDTDTTITVGSKTYTRGSLAASTTATFTLGSGTYTHLFKAYNYTITEAPSIAIGGAGGSLAGGNGKAVLIFNISVEAKVKIGNAWKTVTSEFLPGDEKFRSPIRFKTGNTWKDITAAYVKINGAWKAIFNSGINFVGTAAGFGDATGNASSGTPGSGGTGGGGGCSIICTKLHELGYLSDEIYRADEMFGQWLRQTDPNAYYGYLKWARVVVDWMSNEGPQCMFWIQDKVERNARQKDMAVKWAKRIATPWAQHMAYKMGVLKEDNRAGRWIMNIGITVSRIVGKFVKHTNQPTKNVAIGYAMWAMFGLLYMIAGVK